MPIPWNRREAVNAHAAALAVAADFVAACKAQGDTENYFRWRNVLWQEKLKGPRENGVGTVPT